MSAPLDFYFDFSSPYGYFTAARIDEIAARHGRGVNWRPFLLGAVMKTTGRKPLAAVPLVDEYMRRDLPRTARLHRIDFTLPQKFPAMTVAACRAYYWQRESDAELARKIAWKIYAAYFAEGQDIADTETLLGICAAAGAEREKLAAALQDQRIKDLLRRETEAAAARKVFGSPFVFVDGEAFWGDDRLPQVERWLQSGGW